MMIPRHTTTVPCAAVSEARARRSNLSPGPICSFFLRAACSWLRETPARNTQHEENVAWPLIGQPP